MNKLPFEIKYPKGATPLDKNEMSGLIPDYISTQGELNELERDNILDAIKWIGNKKHKDCLSITFAYKLHKKMFGRVWKWAGEPRKSDKNIGRVFWDQVPTQLDTLFKNTLYWIEHQTYSWDELGARFHHKLTFIHPFANGNGRHARLLTDLVLTSYDQQPFSWGSLKSKSAIETEGPIRDEYLASLKEADGNKFERLISFVRS